MLRTLQRLWTDESGANAVEYGMLACIMAVVVVAFAASGLTPLSALQKIALLLGGDEVVWPPSPRG